jgi:hypothetical protein
VAARRAVTDGCDALRPRTRGGPCGQDVAGEHGAPDELALAVLDLHLFGRDDNLVDVVLHVQGGDAVLEVRLHPVLHAGVGVDHEPVARLGPQGAAELLERVLGSGLALAPRLARLGGSRRLRRWSHVSAVWSSAEPPRLVLGALQRLRRLLRGRRSVAGHRRGLRVTLGLAEDVLGGHLRSLDLVVVRLRHG